MCVAVQQEDAFDGIGGEAYAKRYDRLPACREADRLEAYRTEKLQPRWANE